MGLILQKFKAYLRGKMTYPCLNPNVATTISAAPWRTALSPTLIPYTADCTSVSTTTRSTRRRGGLLGLPVGAWSLSSTVWYFHELQDPHPMSCSLPEPLFLPVSLIWPPPLEVVLRPPGLVVSPSVWCKKKTLKHPAGGEGGLVGPFSIVAPRPVWLDLARANDMKMDGISSLLSQKPSQTSFLDTLKYKTYDHSCLCFLGSSC